MAGRPGQTPWNKMTLADHVRYGTVRPERHLTPARGQGLRRLTEAEKVAPIAPALLAGLREGGPGRDFLRVSWATFTGWTPNLLVLLREASLLLDQLDTLRGQKGERAAQRLLVSVLSQLRMPVE